MGTINDFKNVRQNSINYSKYLDLDESLNEDIKARFGFYVLVLECVTGVTEINEIREMIIDTEFRSIHLNERNNDLGVDAVFINDDQKTIQLFNFKHRDNYRVNKGQTLKDMIDVSKFLLPILSENTVNITTSTKKYIDKIIELQNSTDQWKIELYMVSNDNIPLSAEDTTVKQFIDNYDLALIPITIDELVAYISDTPKDLKAKIMIDSTSVMTYEVDKLSTSKSYLIKLSLADLIRITCTDEKIRNLYNLKDYSQLRDVKLDLSLLYDNVRGYLGEKTKYNKNIIKTISDSPNKFFMYNNGLTITAKDIKARYMNGNKKFECEINGFQIVNGGQTLRSIYDYCSKHFDEEKLANAEILIRLFQTESDITLTNSIAEYTNSQNAVSSIDLKSVHNFQIQLESYLKTFDIHYIRKTGQTGIVNNSPKRITMQRLAQIIFSDMGNPNRATNQKNALFEKHYNDIFEESPTKFEEILKLVNLYFKIEEEYRTLTNNVYEGKFLYVIYIKKQLPTESISGCIDLLEKALNEYKQHDDLSQARKLIQTGFLGHVNNTISMIKA